MAWEPPSTLEEQLRGWIVPPRWHIRYETARALRRGERELSFLPFLVPLGSVAIDAGANKGVWSEVLRRRCAVVHAFEPNPKIFRILARGAGPGVRTYKVALSDQAGTAELRVPRNRGGNYSNQGASLSTVKVGDGDYGSVMIEARRLDDYRFDNVGFIKVDVEGFELAVLAGAAETLARCRPNLVVEIEEKHAKLPIADMLATICAHGYEAFALVGGVLRRVASIDLVAHHTAPERREDYVFNWIFLPLAS